MSDQNDILGRKPMRKKSAHKDDPVQIDGPSIEELCAPVSAKVIPKRVLAKSDGYLGAMKAQRMEGRR